MSNEPNKPPTPAPAEKSIREVLAMIHQQTSQIDERNKSRNKDLSTLAFCVRCLVGALDKQEARVLKLEETVAKLEKELETPFANGNTNGNRR
jgi:hypothetical protein